MRILDKNNNEILEPDYSLGYVQSDKIFVKHHDAIPAVAEKWHYKVIATYPNGGKDLDKVIDIPEVKATDAWDEYEEILRYVPYTKEELEQKNKPNPNDDRDAMLIDLEYRIAMIEVGKRAAIGESRIFETIKRLANNGLTNGLSEKAKLFFSTGKISSDQYSELKNIIKKGRNEGKQ